MQRLRLTIRGTVQGVGFRPFVYALAIDSNLSGFVGNESGGVFAEIEGKPEDLQVFLCRLQVEMPPLSHITEVKTEDIKVLNDKYFRIVESESRAGENTHVSPDVSVCKDCWRELFDKKNRRFRHPFINCTNCGPRFTIIKNVPYDRPQTTMSAFEMCEKCFNEYENPLDRRFHAQPNACRDCGARVWFVEKTTGAQSVPVAMSASFARKSVLPEFNSNCDASFFRAEATLTATGTDCAPVGESAIVETQKVLAENGIVAVKGTGGFHLVCDARSDAALRILRERKGRVDKPFAVMCRDLKTAKSLVEINESEEKLLTSKERPIVLLRKKPNDLSENIAPNNHFLGVMLPYSPLHFLLLNSIDKKYRNLDVLVMTSGNFSNEPIVKDNAEALEKLSNLADAFLLHNREIFVPCDDSVVRIVDLGLRNSDLKSQIPNPKSQIELPLRRSRGYAPFPVELPFKLPPILAVGGELKATFCLAKDEFAFMSQHIGDMENLETLDAFEKSVDQMRKLFRIEPEIVAFDKHPNYLSARWAKENLTKLFQPATKLVGVQHHHAHIASVMAENGVSANEKVIGFAFDGTGYGDDGAIWGGEVLLADYRVFERAAHLKYFPLAGSDVSIKKPYRVALALLWQAGVDWDENLPCVAACSVTERKILLKQFENNLNTIPTSSFGRLFDAVASIAGVRQSVTYEAQAAIEFESALDETISDAYEFDLIVSEPVQIDCAKLISKIAADVLARVPVAEISAKFNNAVADLILRLAVKLRTHENLNKVALSGGCFQNVALLRASILRLREHDFEILTHRQVPPNDGGLALGQAMIAGFSKMKS